MSPKTVGSATAADPCGCPDFRSAGLTRRGMFQLAGVAGITVATTASQARVAMGAPGTGNRVLVVLSLRGGMDGLSLVAPVADPAYIAARPNIAIPSKLGLQLDNTFAFHPALAPLMPLWKSKQLAVVHATGLPAANRSHFHAMAQMETAAIGSAQRTGWIDRLIGLAEDPEVMAGANLGGSRVPQSLRGPVPTVGVQSLAQVGLGTGAHASSISAWREAVSALHGGSSSKTATSLTGVFDLVQEIGGNDSLTAKSRAEYPATGLGEALADVARLVRMDVGVQVATIDRGDWDMHAAMGSVEAGLMKESVADLGSCLAAFAKDLGPDLSRVTLVTLSEFGRRVMENGSNGTDHGYGNASFVLGGGVNGGKVYGRWPGLKPENLVAGDLAVTTDYRAILAELVADRMSASQLSTVFPDYRPASLGLVRA